MLQIHLTKRRNTEVIKMQVVFHRAGVWDISILHHNHELNNRCHSGWLHRQQWSRDLSLGDSSNNACIWFNNKTLGPVRGTILDFYRSQWWRKRKKSQWWAFPFLKGFHSSFFFFKYPYFCGGIASVKIYLESQICLKLFNSWWNVLVQQGHSNIPLTWSSLFQMNSPYSDINQVLFVFYYCGQFW